MANNYLNKKVDLTTTNITTLYTVPAETTGVIKSILVSNDSASQDTITVTITNGSSVFSVYKLESVDALSTKELLLQPLIVGDKMVSFVEKGTIDVLISGQKTQKVDVDTEVTVKNLKTNIEYSSDQEAEDDVNNSETTTVQEDVSRSVNIKIAKLPNIISESEDE